MRVLVACEESQVVTIAFRQKGHEAFSCDVQECSGGYPEWHLLGDMFDYTGLGWDLIIAHPPCTYIAVSGNAHYAGSTEREEAAKFIQRIWNLPIEKLCIENPVGQINKYNKTMPKPQYIQPWQFGDDASKKTGLWKRGLPNLVPTNIIKKDRYENQTPSGQNKLGPSPNRAKLRSKTYQGIAQAMADQWGEENAS